MTKIPSALGLSAFLLGASPTGAYASDKCTDIGWVGLAEATDETTLVGALSGDMTGTYATIQSRQVTETGLILDMEHHFITDRNGFLKTVDKAVLTAVPGKDQTYMAEIQYDVVESRGVFAGYKGQFHSYGLIKLGKGHVVLRFKGEICK